MCGRSLHGQETDMTDQVTEIMRTWGVDRATAERQVAQERETARRDRLKVSGKRPHDPMAELGED